jgi:beta-lactamase regulating signal transducer with metallopeptidase domain
VVFASAVLLISAFLPGVPTITVIKNTRSVQVGMEIVPAKSAVQFAPRQASPVKQGSAIVFLLLAALTLAYVGRELFKLYRFLSSTHTYKKAGRVRVLISSHADSPFSFWIPGRRYIVLPYLLLASAQNARLCVAHEVQHHRQHDTQWVYALLAGRVMFFLNPAMHLWHGMINQIQEFSCDEVLLGRKNFSPEKYIGCLVEVAENSLRQATRSECATGVGFVKGHNLKRRIEFMINSQKKNHGWLPALVAVSVVILSVTAYAAKDLVEEKQVVVEKADDPSDTPYSIHLVSSAKLHHPDFEEVTDILSEIQSNPVYRKFYRDGLRRFGFYKKDFEHITQNVGVPRKLIGIGLLETGFQDLPPQNGNFERSTGMWQIIRPTAQYLGLVVDNNVDERRDVLKAADAAMRYLHQNHKLLGSWDLAVMSYNAGEKAVLAAIKKSHSTDPWVVRKELPPETQRYYVKWLATQIIMGNPKLVQ